MTITMSGWMPAPEPTNNHHTAYADTMPFGKHKGEPIASIPRNYLIWLKRNVPLHGRLAEQVNAVLDGKPLPQHRNIDEELERIVKPFNA